MSPRQHICSEIQALYQSNKGIREISNLLKVSRNTVQKWVKCPDGNIADAQGSGRPSKLSPAAKLTVRNMVMDKVGIKIR